MSNFNTQRQDDLIRALIAHPDNNMQSPLFALGYMASMMDSLIRRMPQEQRDIFLLEVDRLIDRHKAMKQDQKVAG